MQRKIESSGLFHHHVPPVNVNNPNFLMSNHCKSIGVGCPEYSDDILWEFDPPFDFLSHGVKDYNLCIVDQQKGASFPVEFGMSFFFK